VWKGYAYSYWKWQVLKKYRLERIQEQPYRIRPLPPHPPKRKCKEIMGDFQLVSIVQVKILSWHTYKVQSMFTVFSRVLIFAFIKSSLCLQELCRLSFYMSSSMFPLQVGLFLHFFLQLSNASRFPVMGVSGDKCTTRMSLVSRTTFSGVAIKTSSHFPVEVIIQPNYQILDLI